MLIIATPGLTLSEGWRESDFDCPQLGRRLQDQELLATLRTSIQNKWVAARNLEIPSIEQMQSADPACCGVVSDPEKNPWADDSEKSDVPWWRRLLEGPRLLAYISHDDPEGTGVTFSGHGLLNTCGDVLYMTFWMDK
ncbi:hypothetical protein [Defluviimonas sp. D31]|uniref:hypothetical protein n=1 Tax=Defluviimonas sp. D31 TaxID=3083253 RepID=UPI00296E301C|nr:hypothetical protein [Defluviimonas sp. D31]